MNQLVPIIDDRTHALVAAAGERASLLQIARREAHTTASIAGGYPSASEG
jgi:hypothetical protein